MNNLHAICDRALATANAALSNALKTNRTFVAALEKIRDCDDGCIDCRRIAAKALAGE